MIHSHTFDLATWLSKSEGARKCNAGEFVPVVKEGKTLCLGFIDQCYRLICMLPTETAAALQSNWLQWDVVEARSQGFGESRSSSVRISHIELKPV